MSFTVPARVACKAIGMSPAAFRRSVLPYVLAEHGRAVDVLRLENWLGRTIPADRWHHANRALASVREQDRQRKAQQKEPA